MGSGSGHPPQANPLKIQLRTIFHSQKGCYIFSHNFDPVGAPGCPQATKRKTVMTARQAHVAVLNADIDPGLDGQCEGCCNGISAAPMGRS